MRKILFTLVCLFALSATAQEKLSRKEKQEKLAAQIAQLVESKQYTIDVDRAISKRGRPINLTSNYTLRLAGDSAYANLPFFGEAYVAPIGQANGGINFETTYTDYSESLTKKRGHEVKFKVRTPEDLYEVSLSITTSGYATIGIRSNKRSFITYHGTTVIPDEKSNSEE